jgi:hypothetical protein
MNRGVVGAWIAPRRLLALLGVVYLGVVSYVVFDALSNGWGWGWALAGTLEVTVTAAVLVWLVWIVTRFVRRIRK